jgi:hypothetical protein
MASDRLLLEQQVRQIDGMMRMMMDMRSVIVRRQRGLMHRRVVQNGAPIDRRLVLNLSPLFNEVAVQEPVRVRVRVRVRVPKKPKTVTRAIKKADLCQPMSDVCSICQEAYVKKDSVTTNCENHFCAPCFTQWMATKQAAGEVVTCPLCRAEVTLVKMFRARATPIKKPKAREPTSRSATPLEPLPSAQIHV